MMRLNKPQYSFEQTLDACMDGITGNNSLREKIESNRADLIAGAAGYLSASSAGDLYTIKSIDIGEDRNPIVINDLKKLELIKIYDQYLVPENKPARRIYDDLLNAAKEDCPFCGGIGRPENLDHFLPKAYFPQFSVLPLNLVPACLDCNIGGKANLFAVKPEDQIIQPYTDNDRFFREQWIFAKYNHGDPGNFEYFVLPPKKWCEVDKQRVKKHFAEFRLAVRYAKQAAQSSGAILRQIKKLQEKGETNESINIDHVQVWADDAPFVNHWKNGMSQALSEWLVKQL